LNQIILGASGYKHRSIQELHQITLPPYKMKDILIYKIII